MDKFVEFRGNGPDVIINTSKVLRLSRPFAIGGVLEGNPYTMIVLEGGSHYTVLGCPEDVVVALGGELVVFQPPTGPPLASETKVE